MQGSNFPSISLPHSQQDQHTYNYYIHDSAMYLQKKEKRNHYHSKHFNRSVVNSLNREKKINQPHIACPISPQLSQTNSSMYRTYDLSLQEKKSHANHHKHSNHLLHATAIHAVFSPIISVASQQRRAGSRHRSDKAVKSSHLGRRKRNRQSSPNGSIHPDQPRKR